jgi:predicted TIM-barrel fold metal-dependent hydrolase
LIKGVLAGFEDMTLPFDVLEANIDAIAGDPRLVGVVTTWGIAESSGERLLARIAELGLTVTTPVYFGDFAAPVHAAARAFPDTTFVISPLNYVSNDFKLRPHAISALEEIAQQPNIYIRVDPGQLFDLRRRVDQGWETAALEVFWRTFGPDRIIFASTWPFIGVRVFHRALHGFLGTKGTQAARKVYRDNAIRAYNLKVT